MTPSRPLERWAEDEALCELARLARDLPDVHADEARHRLERLTEARRGPVVKALVLRPVVP